MEELAVVFLLLSLLSVTQGQTARMLTTRRFSAEAEYNIQNLPISGYQGTVGYSWDNGVLQGTGQKKSDCANICNALPACKSFDYNSNSRECWIHSYDTCPVTSRRICNVCVHYKKVTLPCAQTTPTTTATPTTLPMSTIDPGTLYDSGSAATNLQGGTRIRYTTTRYECWSQCSTDTTCQGFDLNEASKSCWLHKSQTICSNPGHSCQDCVHYKNRRAACYLELSTTPTTTTASTIAPISSRFPIIQNNYSISPDGMWVAPTNSVDSCLTLCDERTWCEAVVYQASVRNCLLHRSTTACSVTPSNGLTVYQHTRFTCGNIIFNDFSTAIANRRRSTTLVIGGTATLVSCLTWCKSNSACTSVNYHTVTTRCEYTTATNKCATLVSSAGYVQYDRSGIICPAVIEGFRSVQNNKKISLGVLKGTFTINECLQNCRGSSTCWFVNYHQTERKCEHGQLFRRCITPGAATGWVHYRKNTFTCPGEAVTVPSCWNVMTAFSPSCTKPRKPSPTQNMENIEGYCRSYNTYFTCIISTARVSKCPTLSRDQFASFIDSSVDLRTNSAQFCNIFSESLQNCLITGSTPSEITRCEVAAVKPAGVNTAASATLCQKYRTYLDCIESIVTYKCSNQAAEFQTKSIRYNLLTSFTNCRALSNPLVKQISTMYGPAKGGSVLIIEGTNLQEFSSPTIYFNGTNACQAISSNATHVTCTTRPIPSSTTVGAYLVVRIQYQASIYFVAGSFVYKPNPNVVSLHPIKTVIGGGTTLTINGTNLIYVVTPTLEVTGIDSVGTRQTVSSVCMTNPIDMAADDMKSLTCVVPNITMPTTTTDEVKPGQRVRNVLYWNGLTLDGENKYSNLTISGVMQGDRLEVFGPPDIKETPDEVYEFKSFWPVEQSELELPGMFLDTAATSEDYQVLVGSVPCTNVRITPNKLISEPPKENPMSDGSSPPIVVKAPGPNTHNSGLMLGNLDYQSTIFDNTAGKYGLIGGALIVVILLIILIVICCCCCACCPGGRKKE